MNFQFDKKQLYEFLNLSMTFITIQIYKILPLLISTLLISLYGNHMSLPIFGMASTIIALFYVLPTKAITESLEINVEKSFDNFKKNQIPNFFWKSLCLLAIINLLVTILFFQSDVLLIKLNFEIQFVQRLSQYLCWSLLFIILQGFNILIQGFYTTIEDNNIARKMNLASNFLLILFYFYFIQYESYQEYGYIYAKILQEIINCFCSIYLVKFKIHQEFITFPKMHDLIENVYKFFQNCMIFGVQHLKSFLCLDFSIFMASQLRDENSLSSWIIFVGIYQTIQMICLGFGMCMKYMIKNYSKTNSYIKIKNYCLHLFLYVLVCSIFLQLLVFFQRKEIAEFFSDNENIQLQIVQCFNISLMNIQFEVLFFVLQALLELTKEDQKVFYFNLIFDPLYTIICAYVLCFVFNKKLEGLIIAITTRKVISTFIYLKLLKKIDSDTQLNFSKSQLQENFIQMSVKNDTEDDSFYSSSEMDQSFKISKKKYINQQRQILNQTSKGSEFSKLSVNSLFYQSFC